MLGLGKGLGYGDTVPFEKILIEFLFEEDVEDFIAGNAGDQFLWISSGVTHLINSGTHPNNINILGFSSFNAIEFYEAEPPNIYFEITYECPEGNTVLTNLVSVLIGNGSVATPDAPSAGTVTGFIQGAPWSSQLMYFLFNKSDGTATDEYVIINSIRLANYDAFS